MAGQLDGKRALVTGAASGIGRASAEALVAEGATVIGLDRQDAATAGFETIICDLRHEDQIVGAVARAGELLAGLDILVNAAGVLAEAPLKELTADSIDMHFAINVRGTILVTREALPLLGAGARIINIASELAVLGRQNASAYVASKAAVIGLTRSWARELAPSILVNAVAPGPTDTPLLGFENLSPEQQDAELALPLARLGQPSEIADAVMFLAGPRATFITGHCLSVNGGAAMT